jgi:hypothetical protein
MNSEDGLSAMIVELLGAVAEHDDDYFPVSMMGSKWANAVCGDLDDSYPPATEMTKRGCAKRKADREQWEKDWEVEQKLAEDPAKLDGLCKAAPEAERDRILNQACYNAQFKAERARMDAAADRMLRSPKALDPQCAGMRIPRYDTPKTALGAACQKRQEAVRAAKQIEYAGKMEKDPALIDILCTMEYPQFGADDPVEAACASATSSRDVAASMAELEQLRARPRQEREAKCMASAADTAARSSALQSICGDLGIEQDTAERKYWNASPEKLTEACLTTAKMRYGETVLEQLCAQREEARVDALARALAKDPEKLRTTCKATPHPARDDVLFIACERYRDGVPEEDATLIAAMAEGEETGDDALSAADIACIKDANGQYASAAAAAATCMISAASANPGSKAQHSKSTSKSNPAAEAAVAAAKKATD